MPKGKAAMADRAKTVRERRAGLLDLTEPRRGAATHTLAELAAHISAVLTHPLTPSCVRDDLLNSVNDLATPESFYNSVRYIEGRLSGVAELPQEGGGS